MPYDVGKENFTVNFLYISIQVLKAEPILKYKPKSVKQRVYTAGFYRPSYFTPHPPPPLKQKTVHNEIQSLQRHAIGNSVFNVISGVPV